jgi:hypothetical protein
MPESSSFGHMSSFGTFYTVLKPWCTVLEIVNPTKDYCHLLGQVLLELAGNVYKGANGIPIL